jgi:hypothetical protein
MGQQLSDLIADLLEAGMTPEQILDIVKGELAKGDQEPRLLLG